MLWFFHGIGIMVSPSDPFWQYDFDNAYFNSDDDDMDIGGFGDDMDTSFNDDDMDISDCDDDMTTGADMDLEYDSEEEEFWFVFPLIGEMVAYFQRHYDKRPQRIAFWLEAII